MPILSTPSLKRVYLSRFANKSAWVDIVERHTVGETELMEELGVSAQTSPMTVVLMTVATVIKAWNFTDEAENPLPITLENVRHLDEQDLRDIEAAIIPSTQTVSMSPQKKRSSSTTSKPKPTI